MPANLSPEYKIAEEKFRQATTTEEKLKACEEMLAAIPKHKGTEKMQADIKKRISKLRGAQGKKGGAVRQKPAWHIDKEGAGQIVLVGPPNSGKSSLVKVLTGAEPEVADYPFTTHMPLPGMASYKHVGLQLVDLPPIARQGSPPWLASAIRLGDLMVLVFDVSSDEVLTEAEMTMELLNEFSIKPGLKTAHDRKQMATVVVCAKADGDPDRIHTDMLLELLPELQFVSVSIHDQDMLSQLVKVMYDGLGVVRMYTRPPGKKPDFTAPFVVKKGTTVVEAAAVVHKDIAQNLKTARIWNDESDGLLAARDYVIQDGDVVEFKS